METNFVKLHSEQAKNLKSIKGEKISTIKLVKYIPWNTYHTSSPIVLNISNRNLELWSIYTSEFSIRWDTIDFKKSPFHWIDKSDKESQWVSELPKILSAIVEQRIQSVSLIQGGSYCNGISLNLERGLFTASNSCDNMYIKYTSDKFSHEEELIDVPV